MALHAVLHGGEDYELLFAASPTARIPRSIAGVPITRIGTLHRLRANKPRITLTHPTEAPAELKPAGWQHFS